MLILNWRPQELKAEDNSLAENTSYGFRYRAIWLRSCVEICVAEETVIGIQSRIHTANRNALRQKSFMHTSPFALKMPIFHFKNPRQLIQLTYELFHGQTACAEPVPQLLHVLPFLGGGVKDAGRLEIEVFTIGAIQV